MDERDQGALMPAEQPEAPATEETTETVERVPWQQQLATVQPVAGELEESGEGGEVGDSEGGELVEAEGGEVSLADYRPLSPSQLTEVLEYHGVYSDPSRYALPDNFDPTLVGGEAVLAKFFDIAAENLVSQSATDALLGLVAEADAEQRQVLYDADVEHKGQMEIILRSEWGDQTPARLEELKEFLDQAPGQLGEAFIDARTSDGRRLIDHPEFPLVLSDLLRGNGSPRSNASERLEKINNVLKRDPARYFRDKLDEEAISLRRQVQLEQSAEEIAGTRPVSRREQEIRAVMRRDMTEYFRRGLDKELAKILAARASRGQ